MARPFKKSIERGALMVFVDEAGFSMVPCLKSTWAPLAQTPVVRHRNRWHRKVSVIGALVIDPTRKAPMQLLSDWHPDKHVKKEEATAFLAKLAAQFPGRPILVVWDKLQAHRSAMAKAFVAANPRMEMHFLPSYAPDLNPVERVWSLSKYHRMANHGIDKLDELQTEAQRHVNAVGARQQLLEGCVKHAGLLDALYQASAQ